MEAMSLFSMAGSAFSTVATAYFWLVRNRREQPNLRAYVADRELFLGSGGPETRQIGLKLGLIVANYSLLPNSLLGVKVGIRLKDGAWQPVQRLTFDAQTPLPFNVPSMQTVLLRVNGSISFPYLTELEAGNKPLTSYLERFVAEPREFQVELRSLNNRLHTSVAKAA